MNRSLSSEFWRGKRVFISGHSGFKGSWLAVWLSSLGAECFGYSLAQDQSQKWRFEMLAPLMGQQEGDINDYAALAEAMEKFQPELAIHLAAQALVRLSYQEPLATFAANVMGTATVLEAVRQSLSPRCVLIVTTDKCYEDQQWPWGYRETDRLGGYDPYSASKAAAELVCGAWRSSFLAEAGVAVMSARAGNVIGGGDWAQDRLVPDLVRAFSSGQSVHLRKPQAVRPWQHVLEPLGGYMHLLRLAFEGQPVAGAWNFGPDESQIQTVEWMTEQFSKAWGAKFQWTRDEGPHPHETELLRLDCSKARGLLGWRPVLGAAQALEWTAQWYRRALAGEKPLDLCREQIEAYTAFCQERL